MINIRSVYLVKVTSIKDSYGRTGIGFTKDSANEASNSDEDSLPDHFNLLGVNRQTLYNYVRFRKYCESNKNKKD